MNINIYLYLLSKELINFYDIVYLDFCEYVNVPPPIAVRS